MDNSDNPLNENFVIDLKKQNDIIDMSLTSTWGNSIFFNHWETREIAGHMTPLPKEGDILVSKMRSEKTALFKIIEIRPCNDPADMFFGTVSDLGYIEDIQKALIEFGTKLQEFFNSVSDALAPIFDTPEFLEMLKKYQEEQD